MNHIRTFGLTLLLICAIACTEQALPDATATTLHQLVSSTEEDEIIIPSRDAPKEPAGSLARTIAALRAAHDEGKTIGRESGGVGDMFGEVTDVVQDPKGNLYVLDALNGTIKLYDREARFLGSFARPGHGPNELFIPVAFELLGDSLLLVAQKNRVVKTFRLEGTARIVETASFTLDFNPEDLCWMRDRIYVRGYRPDSTGTGTIIHVYDLQGKEMASFGEPYEAEHPLMRSILSAGNTIVCLPSEGIVATSYTYLPSIRAYTTAGERLWSARFADFQPVNVRMARTASGSPELRFGRPFAGMDMVEALLALPEGLLLVQTLEAVDLGIEPNLHSFIMDPAGKTAAYAGSTLWRARSSNGNTLFFTSNVPYPQLRIARYTSTN